MRLKLNRPLSLWLIALLTTATFFGSAAPTNGVVAVASFTFQPPVPIAAAGTLSNGTTVNLTVTAKDSGGNPIPGATVWFQFFPTAATVPGSAMACGQALGAAKSCVADGSGNVSVTYTAGNATLGADLIQVQDAAVPTIAPANDTYCYDQGKLKITPAPIGTQGTLLAGGVRGGVVTDVDKDGNPIPGATITLSLAQINPEGSDFKSLPPNGSGKALSAGASSWTTLGLTPVTFVTDGKGQVPFFYRTPTQLPSDLRDDSLIAGDKDAHACLSSAHYRFLPTTANRTDRIFGSDRFATAAGITSTYEAYGTADTVFVATGLNFPDALAGAAAAGKLGAPVLLLSSTGIPSVVATQLTRLKPRHIVILGGTGVVSSATATQLHAYAADVQRYGGIDRYATAQLIAQHYFATGVDTVFIATGLDFPDALSGGAIAAHQGSPILLVGGGSTLPAATTAALNALRPKHIVILGGTGVVSTTQATVLQGYAPIVRYGGADRYGTSQLLADHYFASGADIAFTATGANFPDALTGSAIAGALNAPLELVTLNSIPPATLSSLTNVVKPHSIVVLGGTGVVSDAVKNQLSTIP